MLRPGGEVAGPIWDLGELTGGHGVCLSWVCGMQNAVAYLCQGPGLPSGLRLRHRARNHVWWTKQQKIKIYSMQRCSTILLARIGEYRNHCIGSLSRHNTKYLPLCQYPHRNRSICSFLRCSLYYQYQASKQWVEIKNSPWLQGKCCKSAALWTLLKNPHRCGKGGIGEALVLEYTRRGVHAIATVLPNEDSDHLTTAGITWFPLDVRDEKSVIHLKEEILAVTNGYLDFLVNNA